MGALSRHFPEPYIWVNVFRSLVRVLREDPVLASIDEITWDIREGSRNEAMPPSPDMLPWIAVVPLEMGGIRKATETDDRCSFKARIDIAVAGTDWDDLGNLAGAVRQALMYDKISPDGTLTVDRFFRAAGATDYWLRQSGVGVKRTEGQPATTSEPSPPPIVDQLASAVVEFELFMPTLRSDDNGFMGPVG